MRTKLQPYGFQLYQYTCALERQQVEDKFNQALDRAWFFCKRNRFTMERNRRRWPLMWRSLLRWMQEDRRDRGAYKHG